MKNCAPAVSGPLFAIDNIPRLSCLQQVSDEGEDDNKLMLKRKFVTQWMPPYAFSTFPCPCWVTPLNHETFDIPGDDLSVMGIRRLKPMEECIIISSTRSKR
jgi:hypothetical protein